MMFACNQVASPPIVARSYPTQLEKRPRHASLSDGSAEGLELDSSRAAIDHKVELGAGSFGRVYQGTWRSHKKMHDMAFKQLAYGIDQDDAWISELRVITHFLRTVHVRAKIVCPLNLSMLECTDSQTCTVWGKRRWPIICNRSTLSDTTGT